MFINRLLGRISDRADSVDQHAGDQATARHSLRRRDQRIKFLKQALKNERRQRIRELASKETETATLRQLIAARSSAVDIGGRDAPTLEKELTMVTALLDEFEAEAILARSADIRIRELEAEAQARETVIATLGQDINAWRSATLSVA